jgi:choline transporter-like protein 2/4/5
VGIFYKKCQVAAKAIGAIPSLIIYPIIPFLVAAAFLIYWLAALLYLASAGSVTQNNCNNSCAAYDLTLQAISDNSCCGYSLHHSKNIAWAIVYHIFGVFWITQFIIACCLTTIAGAIAAYYWARGETAELGWAPVLSSAKRVVRYSLGSMALGSLLVAIIEMIRFILEFIRKRLKLLESAPGGCCLSILFCCAQCCLGCIEWTIKFINRNAYIVVFLLFSCVLGCGSVRFDHTKGENSDRY